MLLGREKLSGKVKVSAVGKVLVNLCELSSGTVRQVKGLLVIIGRNNVLVTQHQLAVLEVRDELTSSLSDSQGAVQDLDKLLVELRIRLLDLEFNLDGSSSGNESRKGGKRKLYYF